MGWNYDAPDCHDICIKLFDACLKAGAPMRFEPGMKVLEVGCNESDWMERAQAAWPECEFVGIDTAIKDQPPSRLHRNVLERDIFPAESFDAVVGISSLEHIGLGHYGDPKHADGDSVAFANIWHWLKPGGWLYFDVPYDPEKYWLAGANQTECRVYDWPSIYARLARHWSGLLAFDAYADIFTDARALIPKPTTSRPSRFYCVSCVWWKV